MVGLPHVRLPFSTVYLLDNGLSAVVVGCRIARSAKQMPMSRAKEYLSLTEAGAEAVRVWTDAVAHRELRAPSLG